jgi:hypothetical protein
MAKPVNPTENPGKCGACDAPLANPKRIDAGVRYCASCYNRLFKKSHCTSCAVLARFHIYAEIRICRPCLRKKRTCAQCSSALPRASFTDERGAYCGSCANGIRPRLQCERCGQPARGVSKYPSRGIEISVCAKCSNALANDHATCCRCQRHRFIAVKIDGIPYCKSCEPGNERSYACPTCGVIVPGSGRAVCRSCGDQRRLDSAIISFSLQLPISFRRAFADFSRDTSSHASAAEASRVIKRQFPFWLELAHLFSDPESVALGTLLKATSAEYLRRNTLSVRYLSSIGAGVVPVQERERFREKRRIGQILTLGSSSPWSSLLKQYERHLRAGPKLKIRTIRTYLTCLRSFLNATKRTTLAEIESSDVARVIHYNPGLRASCMRAFRFLNEELGTAFVMPLRPRDQPRAHARKEKRTLGLVLNELRATRSRSKRRGLLAYCLATLYSIPLESTLRTKVCELQVSPKSISWRVDSHKFALPASLRETVIQVLAPPRTRESFLFSADDSRPLHPTSVRYHVRQIVDHISQRSTEF